MRVISGQARGRKLFAPDGLNTRPTSDRVKESIFNIISPYIPCHSALDLFAGSGGLGIEALSRGSSYCAFVDMDQSALAVVKKNLELSRQAEKSEVFLSDAFDFLKRTQKVFDVIFLDPPYNKGFFDGILEKIHALNLLMPGGIIVLEGEKDGEAPKEDYFRIIKTARYGKTMVFIMAEKSVK